MGATGQPDDFVSHEAIPAKDLERATHFVHGAGWTDTPYSTSAASAGRDAVQEEFDERGLGDARLIVGVVLDAAHDRSVLDLDASVHAGSYRQELLRELADSFRAPPVDLECEDVALFAMETRARIRREVIEEVAAWLFARPGHEPIRRAAEDLLHELEAVEVPDGQ